MRAANNFLGRIAYDENTYDGWVKLLYDRRQDVVDILHQLHRTFDELDEWVPEEWGDLTWGDFDQLKAWVEEGISISWDTFTAVQDMNFEDFVQKYWWLPTKFTPNNEYSGISAYMMTSFAPYGDSLWFMPVRMAHIQGFPWGRACIGEKTQRLFIGDTRRGHAYALRYCTKTQEWQKLDSMAWRKAITDGKDAGTFHTRRSDVQPDVNVSTWLNDEFDSFEKLIQLGEGFDLNEWQNIKERLKSEGDDPSKEGFLQEAGMDGDNYVTCYAEGQRLSSF